MIFNDNFYYQAFRHVWKALKAAEIIRVMEIKQDGQSLIRGLHHVTSLASNPGANNRFFTRDLGLRRIKQTVNFDATDTYNLYYGNEAGHPGTVLACFPFPTIQNRCAGTGEVGSVVFSVPVKSLKFWKRRLAALGFKQILEHALLGEKRLYFKGLDGECLELVECGTDGRPPWTHDQIPQDVAIRGFHSVSLRLSDSAPMAELLRYMGYEETDKNSKWHRFQLPGGNGANIIDIETSRCGPSAREGAGSVHRIALAVEDTEALLMVREALLDTGYPLTQVMDCNYFSAVYFRTPCGVLFEIATNEPGFAKDEEIEHLGECLKLPRQHEHLREFLKQHLEPLDD